MSAGRIGFFGKLPSHGDFIRRGVSENFVNVWDSWLQECMVESRRALDARWLNVYLTSPIWRFVLCDGVIGAASYAGILLPSVDKVGRYFPFTIVTELPADAPPAATIIRGRAWFENIEELALGALNDDDFKLEAFEAALEQRSLALGDIDSYQAVMLDAGFPSRAHHWRVPIASADRVAASLIDPLMGALSRAVRPLSLWWSEGSEQVPPSCLLSRALPNAARFTAMLDGQWSERGWDGHFGEFAHELTAVPFQYVAASAGVTDKGPVRELNQDSLLDRADLGLWAVADGMGGHSRGDEASQMTVNALASMEPVATVSTALGAATEVLNRVNDDLRRATQHAPDHSMSGTTVVLLSVRQQEWAVLWAGDSRAYLLRDGSLSALTQDHSADAASEITRAVGGQDALVLDHNSGELRAGDRFLLCSDGVHGVVSDAQLSEVLASVSDAAAAAQKIVAAALSAGSSDNATAVVVFIVPES